MKNLNWASGVLLALLAATPLFAANKPKKPTPEITNCNYKCESIQMLSTSVSRGQSCNSIWKKHNFYSMQQMIGWNRGHSDLSCAGGLHPGQVICYPQTKPANNNLVCH